MVVHCIKHVPFEGPGAIADWAAEQGHEIVYIKAYLDQQFPDPADCRFVVVMGGPMNIYEYGKYPWLKDERRFLKAVVEAGTCPVLGICLGAQLLADVLGGGVTKGEHREVGFFPIEKTPEAEKSRIFAPLPEVLKVLHWHGDTFSIPPGALRTAKSLFCANQAFAFQDRVVGLQFHMETTAESLKAIQDNCPDDMDKTGRPSVQSAGEMAVRPEVLADMHRHLWGLLDRLAAR